VKILIVDDMLYNRKLLAALLKPLGTCDAVEGGREAIDAFEGGIMDGSPYDVVFLDIVMPEINGQQVLQVMRNVERQHRVAKESVIFMVTAVDSPQSVLHAFYQGGCDDYIVKPINKEELFEKLEGMGIVPVHPKLS
jgi:two-component system chemotaxis response regulator CheY